MNVRVREGGNLLDYFEQYVFYAMAGLLAWLCLSAISAQKDSAVILSKVGELEKWAHGISSEQDSQGNRLSRVEQALADGKENRKGK